MEQIKLKPMSLLLKEKVFDSIRLYDGKPSVTSVLKILKDSDAFEQMKKYNTDKFNAMLQRKAAAGTLLHKAIEDTYTKGKLHLTVTEHNKAWLDWYTKKGYKFKPIHLEHFVTDGVVGGTIDAIMSFNGSPLLLDRKTCGQRSYPELIFKYKLQLSKYADMYRESTGPLDSIGIVQFSSVGWYKMIQIPDEDYYLDIYQEVLAEFNKCYDIYKSLSKQTGT